jgi:VWFA-related protein
MTLASRTSLMIRTAHLLVLGISAAALQLHAQKPLPQATFRGGTDLVQVDVAVLDGKRRPVRGLTAEDFTVFEDGQPRDIQAFTEVYLPDRVQPVDSLWTREVPSDVATNQVARDEGRLVIILLDRTIPVGEPTVSARRIAAAAIEQLGPGDLAAVVSTSNGAVQNLTSDRERLLRTINDADLSTGISDEAKEIERGVFALTGREWSTLNDGRCQCGLCVPETITRVADAVQGSSGRRKFLLFIGSDLLLQVADAPGRPSNDIGCQTRLKDARETMFAAVDRANLTIHSLDPSGLVNPNPTSRASSPVRPGSGMFAAGALAAGTADLLHRQGNLQVLPDRTGGRAVMNTNGPDRTVPGIFRESDSYYLIGFRPGDPSANGKFHRITVKPTRRGLDVRARSGYTAAAPSAAVQERIDSALTGLLPAGAAPLNSSAAAFAIPGTRNAAVLLTMGVSAFAPAAAVSGNAPRGGPVEIVATAFDSGGRPKAIARHVIELSRSDSTLAADQQVEALSRLDLAPGEYEIRVAVSGAAGTGSVFSYLTVPPFATAPLSLSNIVLRAKAGAFIAAPELVAPLLPFIPTAHREFTKADRFGALFKIYQGTARQDPLVPVRLQSTILDASGAVVATQTSTLDAAQFAQDRTADHYLAVPLATLAPGDYLLKVETTMGARVAGRAVRFVVKP